MIDIIFVVVVVAHVNESLDSATATATARAAATATAIAIAAMMFRLKLECLGELAPLRSKIWFLCGGSKYLSRHFGFSDLDLVLS